MVGVAVLAIWPVTDSKPKGLYAADDVNEDGTLSVTY